MAWEEEEAEEEGEVAARLSECCDSPASSCEVWTCQASQVLSVPRGMFVGRRREEVGEVVGGSTRMCSARRVPKP